MDFKTPDEWMVIFGERIAVLRRRAEYRQIDLAQRAGVNLKSLQAIEKGRNVGTHTLFRVLKAMDQTSVIDKLAPPLPPSPKRLYQIEHEGLREPKRIRARAGSNGSNGSNGAHGSHGSNGSLNAIRGVAYDNHPQN